MSFATHLSTLSVLVVQKIMNSWELCDGGEIQSAYLSGQGSALFQMCSSKENISVDVIVRNKKLYELSEHFMEIDRSLEELTESLGVCLLLYLQECWRVEGNFEVNYEVEMEMPRVIRDLMLKI
ncbi:hypothetical protein YC2023_067613 [Brassica napus]